MQSLLCCPWGAPHHPGHVQPQGMAHLDLSKAQPGCRSILFPDCCSPQIKPSVSSQGLGKDWTTSSCREHWPCLSLQADSSLQPRPGLLMVIPVSSLSTAHHWPLHTGMRCPSLAHDACHLMSPSSHRETKWTGKLARDQCFPSKPAPVERRTPLRFQPGIPTSPLPSWPRPGQQHCRGLLPLCLCCRRWDGVSLLPRGLAQLTVPRCKHNAQLPLALASQPCHQLRQMVSEPSSISWGCLATTESC